MAEEILSDAERQVAKPSVYCLRLHPELNAAIIEAARAAGKSRNEYVSDVLVTHLGLGDDLATPPRKPLGQRRMNGTNGHKNGKRMAKVR